MQTGKNMQNQWGHHPFNYEGLFDSFPITACPVKSVETEWRDGPAHFDAVVELSHAGRSANFAVEYKQGMDERTFQNALAHFKRYPLPNDVLPLIVLPYLSEARLLVLEKEQISGIDGCGNGLIMLPGHWYIRAVGRPNRFPREPQVLKNPYRGKAALVGRVLLSRPVFVKLEDIYDEIRRRGGTISLALVSRAVKKLEEDTITRSYEGNKVRLVQPEKLLDTLVGAARVQNPRLLWQGKVTASSTLLPHIFTVAAQRSQKCIVTGLGSTSHYARMATEKTVRIYVEKGSRVQPLLDGLSASETTRFPDLEIYEASDEAFFFNPDIEGSIRWASLLQTYIEMQNGDARFQDSAQVLHTQIMRAAKIND